MKGLRMLRVRRQHWMVLSAALVYGATLAAATLDLSAPPRPEAARSVGTHVERRARQDAAVRAQELAAEIEKQVAAGNGCLTCHQPDTLSMHEAEKQITCVECHGGNAKEPWNPQNPLERVPAGFGPENAQVRTRMQRAHVLPRQDDIWTSSANPPRAGVASLKESAEFIQFVNPSDLRVAERACARCHNSESAFVKKSMMAHGG